MAPDRGKRRVGCCAAAQTRASGAFSAVGGLTRAQRPGSAALEVTWPLSHHFFVPLCTRLLLAAPQIRTMRARGGASGPQTDKNLVLGQDPRSHSPGTDYPQGHSARALPSRTGVKRAFPAGSRKMVFAGSDFTASWSGFRSYRKWRTEAGASRNAGGQGDPGAVLGPRGAVLMAPGRVGAPLGLGG